MAILDKLMFNPYVQQNGGIGKLGAVNPVVHHQEPETNGGTVSLENKIGTPNQYQVYYGHDNYVANKLDLLA